MVCLPNIFIKRFVCTDHIVYLEIVPLAKDMSPTWEVGDILTEDHEYGITSQMLHFFDSRI